MLLFTAVAGVPGVDRALKRAVRLLRRPVQLYGSLHDLSHEL